MLCRWICCLLCTLVVNRTEGAEHLVLGASDFPSEIPLGKEVDAILGDHLLRNDEVVAVVAAPGRRRQANMTVRHVGGSVIDLTRRAVQSDQLSCFYPGGGTYRFASTPSVSTEPGVVRLAFTGNRVNSGSGEVDPHVRLELVYELRDGEPFLRVETTWHNDTAELVTVELIDGVRADGEFMFGLAKELALGWCYDSYWRQAYGVQPIDPEWTVVALESRGHRRPRPTGYTKGDDDQVEHILGPGESVSLARRLFPAPDTLELQALAAAARNLPLVRGELQLVDPQGPIQGAKIQLHSIGDAADQSELYGIGLTDAEGHLARSVPPGRYRVEVSAQAYAPQSFTAQIAEGARKTLEFDEPGYLEATITDGTKPIPAKLELIGTDGTESPDFGPASAVLGVQNLRYTPDGKVNIKLLPGRYRYLVSHGPEYDAAEGEFSLAAGETVRLAPELYRTVDTTGWLSAELHSHSSPSGDNTASQRGRVLNLLAEHLEFAPCTEHQRIDVYDAHLAHFQAEERMLTCPGMELTGNPLPLNHQNAFPLHHHPHHQDGGGPETHPDPVRQIERLVGWDDASEKVVQTNHPNIAQMVGDRDLNNEPDVGFEAMLGHMDVIEVHPPGLIFKPLGGEEGGVGRGGWEQRGNVITNWMQLLNLGYRVTGVVNTDAHYNFHGSGWLRNWVRSSTDNPAEASLDELRVAFEQGHVVMSNGPFLEVTASTDQIEDALPGDLVRTSDGTATLRVVVRCPNWIEVNRVQLFLNGRPVEQHNYTARSHGGWFHAGPNRFDQTIDVALEEDTHLIVAICGEGHRLGAIYGEKEGAAMPVAVANPIFIDTNGDTDGDGLLFEPSGDSLGLPLPTLEGLRPSHGHGHPNHAGH